MQKQNVADWTVPGILVQDRRECEASTIFSFCFITGRETIAVNALLDQMVDRDDLTFSNPRHPSGEGCVVIRKIRDHFETMSGGHGWSSDSRVILRDEAATIILGLTPFNRGNRWDSQAHFERAKRKDGLWVVALIQQAPAMSYEFGTTTTKTSVPDPQTPSPKNQNTEIRPRALPPE